MINTKELKIKHLFIAISVVLTLTACSSSGHEETNVALQNSGETAGTQDELATEEELKASDTAIVIRINPNDNIMTFQTLSTGARYDLNYTGTTEFYDKYQQALSASQIKLGDIANIVISLHSKTLDSFQISSDTFTYDDIDRHIINDKKGMISIGNDNYRIPQKLVVVMGDQIGDQMDINENDILTVTGIDREIYTVTLEKGHGYLRLTGDEAFAGGWIEVGSKIIKPLSKGMLILVPEGDYDMRITYHGFGGNKKIHIDRDKETVVDVSDLKGELLKTGKITFDIKPEEATLRINGKEQDYLLPVELEYGVYQMEITCEGYQTIKKYLSVGQENASVQIEMEKDEDKADSSGTKSSSSSSSSLGSSSSSSSSSAGNPMPSGLLGNRSSSSSIKSSSSSSIWNGVGSASFREEGNDDKDHDSEEEVITSKAQLYIDSPEGTELYFDDVYKGIVPVSFDKESGTHVVTFRKEGCRTKSYTITLNGEDEDESYSFNQLEGN